MIQSIASTDRAVDRRRRDTVENRNATDGAGSDDGGHTESYLPYVFVNPNLCTVIILNIGTDRSEQTVQTQIRLLLMEQSDQGLLCLLFCLHLLNTILHCKIQLFQL